MSRWVRPVVAVGLVGFCVARAAFGQRPNYPPTRVENVVETIHGVEVADPYRWLEASDDAEVQAWTEKQNALTRSYLDRFPDERAALTAELEKLYMPSVASSPAQYGENYFFTRREGLQNHAVLYVRRGGLDAQPQVVIDPNTFSDDGTVALDWWFPSPNGRFVAYGKSASGSEKSTLYLRNVEGGTSDLALQIPYTRACSVAWDADSQGFHYTRYAEPGTVPPGDENYYRHVYCHRFGTLVKDDPKVYGEGRPKEEWPSVSTSSDYKHLLLTTSLDWSKNDLYIRSPGDAEFRPVAVGLDGLFSGDVLGETLFIRTNYKAPRYRIVSVDARNPGEENWKEIIPEQKGVIQSLTIAEGKLVLSILENAYSRLMVYDTDGKPVAEIALPTLGSVSGVNGRPDRPELFYSFQSFAYPPVVFRYDMRSGESKEIDRMELDVDLARYETKQIWYESKDKTRVPMFIIHRNDLKLDGSNPTLLYGYGGFNISLTPTFMQVIFPWLDRGGVCAIANLRGGGEFGKDWHLAGRLEKKQNVFDDMIAAAEKLIADKYTRPEKLGIRGGSNGGLLMGAMLTQRPELFKAVVCQVPLLDMLRYHHFSIARLWIPEYGSAEDAGQFRTLFAYSPYHHVKKGAKYPATLFTTAESDSRVDPMHARKMAAALQAASGSDAPILLWVETKAGHGAGKPLRKIIESQVDYLIFLMWQLGMIGGAA